MYANKDVYSFPICESLEPINRDVNFGDHIYQVVEIFRILQML